MSQQKVDEYKEEKKHRKETMRKERIRTRLLACVLVLGLAALIGWFSWAVYNDVKANQDDYKRTADAVELNLESYSDYQTALSKAVDAASSSSAEE